MSSSRSHNCELRAKAQPGGGEEIEWIVVNDANGNNDNEEGFEIIEASEGYCWCGGKDAESCRLKGHTFPLCEIDKSQFWPEPIPTYVRSSQHEGIWVTSGFIADDAHADGTAESVSGKNNGQSSTLQKPFSDGVDPVSKVMILSKLLRDINRKSRLVVYNIGN